MLLYKENAGRETRTLEHLCACVVCMCVVFSKIKFLQKK